MHTNSASVLNNNNNASSTKNLQAASSSAATSAAATSNHIHPQQQSMSPALGGSSSATGGLVTVTKTLNQGVTAATTPTSGQNIVTGLQLVNMRSGAPTTIQPAGTIVQQQPQQSQPQSAQLAGQRTVATVQPRVVIGSQNVMTTATRPAASQVSVSVSLPGQRGMF